MKVVMDLVLVDNDMGEADRTREAAFRRPNLFVTLSTSRATRYISQTYMIAERTVRI